MIRTSTFFGRLASWFASVRHPGLVISIRTKGMLVFAALIAYSSLVAVFAFHEKNLLLNEFEAIQGMLETEAMLKEADLATFHAVTAVFGNGEVADQEAGLERIRMHYDSLLQRQAALAARLPGAYLNVDDMNAAWAAMRQHPSQGNLNHMVAELVETKNDLDTMTAQVQAGRRTASEHYRKQTNSVAATALVLGLLGLGLLGAIIGLFFRHLAADLRALEERALSIVNGYRGAPLAVSRGDEVGHLIAAVNSMAEALDRHEKQEVLKRQKYFHQEKMAAVGTLAAGVAHEIGNPIAAICGIAQEMMAQREQRGGACNAQDCLECQPQLIYAQTERLAAITREIAEFAAPRAALPEFLDLNAQLRSASSLVRFDKRLQQVALTLELDSQLPAIYGVPDLLTQLVMNLLINAMDALDGVQDRAPAITIATSVAGERVCLRIEDNGAGMDAATLERAFEAFFTTKPAGKGTGLGLSLCYAIVRKHGGSIDLDAAPAQGCRVQVCFPLNDSSYDEEYAL
jgi:two-component system, NtrC family, sensor kinase